MAMTQRYLLTPMRDAKEKKSVSEGDRGYSRPLRSRDEKIVGVVPSGGPCIPGRRSCHTHASQPDRIPTWTRNAWTAPPPYWTGRLLPARRNLCRSRCKTAFGPIAGWFSRPNPARGTGLETRPTMAPVPACTISTSRRTEDACIGARWSLGWPRRRVFCGSEHRRTDSADSGGSFRSAAEDVRRQRGTAGRRQCLNPHAAGQSGRRRAVKRPL